VWVRVPPLPLDVVESIRLDEEPSLNLGGAAGAWAFESPALRSKYMEAIRLDEEPCSKHGTGGEPVGVRVAPLPRKDSQVVWQPRWKRGKPGKGDGRSTRSPSAKP
jgi:hypothetical protein